MKIFSLGLLLNLVILSSILRCKSAMQSEEGLSKDRPILRMDEGLDGALAHPSPKSINIEDLVLSREVVGAGEFGNVLLGIYLPENQLVALKRMAPKFYDSFRKECGFLTLLNDNPFFPKLYGTLQHQGDHVMVLEFVPGGDLYDFQALLGGDGMSDELVKNYAAEIVVAIESMHKLGIVHRDIKPENIMIGRDGNIKLIDLGLACYDKDNTRCGGSHGFIPPECYLAGSPLASASTTDLYALGMTIYVLSQGNMPFEDGDYDKPPSTWEFHEDTDAALVDLVLNLNAHDPSERLVDMEAVRRHPFFAKISWEGFTARELSILYRPADIHQLRMRIMENFREDDVKPAFASLCIPDEEHAKAWLLEAHKQLELDKS